MADGGKRGPWKENNAPRPDFFEPVSGLSEVMPDESVKLK